MPPVTLGISSQTLYRYVSPMAAEISWRVARLGSYECPVLTVCENVVAVIDRLRSRHHARHVAEGLRSLLDDQVPVGDLPPVEEIRRQRSMPALDGITTDVVIAK
jgi:hypothetical protein